MTEVLDEKPIQNLPSNWYELDAVASYEVAAKFTNTLSLAFLIKELELPSNATFEDVKRELANLAKIKFEIEKSK